jgi:hypothetical protein
MFEMEEQLELNLDDGTAYGVDWREMVLIDGQAAMQVNAFLDTKRPPDDVTDFVSDQAYWDTVVSGGSFKADPTVPITLIPGNTAARGDHAHFINAILGSFAINTPRNGLGRIRGRFNSSKRFAFGTLLALVEQSFPTGDTFVPVTNGTDLGAAGTNGVVAAYHVWKKTASAVFTIEVQDSTTTGGAYGAAVTFPTFTAVGADWAEDTVDAGKQFHRVRVNNAGAAETLGIVVVSLNI